MQSVISPNGGGNPTRYQSSNRRENRTNQGMGNQGSRAQTHQPTLHSELSGQRRQLGIQATAQNAQADRRADGANAQQQAPTQNDQASRQADGTDAPRRQEATGLRSNGTYAPRQLTLIDRLPDTFSSLEKLELAIPIIQVTGKTGSGKSTLINYLAGNLQPRKGKFFVNDQAKGPIIGNSANSETIFPNIYPLHPGHEADGKDSFKIQDNGGFLDNRNDTGIQAVIQFITSEAFHSSTNKGIIIMLDENDIDPDAKQSTFQQSITELCNISGLMSRQSKDLSDHLIFIIKPSKKKKISENEKDTIKGNFFESINSTNSNQIKSVISGYLEQEMDERIKEEITEFFMKCIEFKFNDFNAIFRNYISSEDYDLVSLNLDEYLFKNILQQRYEKFKELYESEKLIAGFGTYHRVLQAVQPDNVFIADYYTDDLRTNLMKRIQSMEPLSVTTDDIMRHSLNHCLPISEFNQSIRSLISEYLNFASDLKLTIDDIDSLCTSIQTLNNLRNGNHDEFNRQVGELREEKRRLTEEITKKNEFCESIGWNVDENRINRQQYKCLNGYNGNTKLEVPVFHDRTDRNIGTQMAGRVMDVIQSGLLHRIGFPRRSLEVKASCRSANLSARLEFEAKPEDEGGEKTGIFETASDHDLSKLNAHGYYYANRLDLRNGIYVTAKILLGDYNKNPEEIQKGLNDIAVLQSKLDGVNDRIKQYEYINNQRIDNRLQMVSDHIQQYSDQLKEILGTLDHTLDVCRARLLGSKVETLKKLKKLADTSKNLKLLQFSLNEDRIRPHLKEYFDKIATLRTNTLPLLDKVNLVNTIQPIDSLTDYQDQLNQLHTTLEGFSE